MSTDQIDVDGPLAQRSGIAADVVGGMQEVETEVAWLLAQTVLRPASSAKVRPPVRTLLVIGAESWKAASAAACPATVELIPGIAAPLAPSAPLYVAALHSPAKWLGVDDRPHNDLDYLVDPAGGVTIVYLAFEGLETDVAVFTEANKLATHLKRIGAAKVEFIKLGGLSVAAALDSRPESRRAAYLEGMLAGAETIGRRPAASRQDPGRRSIAPTVDMDSARIYIGDQQTGIILLEAGVRRLRSVKVFDDLKDPGGVNSVFTCDLEISVATPGGVRFYEVQNVADSDLVVPRRWLNRVPGGTAIAVSTEPYAAKAIESAIRAHEPDLVPESAGFKRTGWVKLDGRWGYLTPAGFHTANGITNEGSSNLSPRLMSIGMPDVAIFDNDREREAATCAVAMLDELTVPMAWVGLFGGLVHSVAGLGRGGAGAVIAIYGGKGSGKTTIADGVAAYISRHFGPDRIAMATIDGSVANLGSLGCGLTDSVIIVDDARKRSSQRKAEAQAEGIERLIRMGYGGGSVRYTPKSYNTATQSWEEGQPDLSSPLVIIAGEQLPAGDENGDSSRERIFPVPIRGGLNAFASGNARRYVELASSGLPEIHTAYLIRWMAKNLDEVGWTQWTERWQNVKTGIADSRADLPVSIRVREVSAVPETGIRIWIAYLLELGVLGEKEAVEALGMVTEAVTASTLEHGTINVASNSILPHVSLVNSLRSAVAGRQAFVREHTIASRAAKAQGFDSIKLESHRPVMRMVGVQKLGRGGNGYFLAMQPRDLLSILSTESRYKTLTEHELVSAFRPIAITDTPAKHYKTVVIDGQRVQTIAIPWKEWAPTILDEEIDDALEHAA
jgi:hypothetical protein